MRKLNLKNIKDKIIKLKYDDIYYYNSKGMKWRIINRKLKNKDFEFYRCRRIETLETILTHLNSIKNVKGFTEEDKIKALEEIKETIYYIRNITLSDEDSNEELLCKLYLLLNYGDLTYLLKDFCIKLVNVKTYKFNTKSNYYSHLKDCIIFCKEDYSKYNSYNYLYKKEFYETMRILIYKAIVIELKKQSDLGVKAFISKCRNDYGYNKRYRWCSNKKLLSLIYGEEKANSFYKVN